MKEIITNESRLKFAWTSTQRQLVLDPILTSTLLSRHQDTRFDVLSTEINHPLVFFQMKYGPLEYWIGQVIASLFVEVGSSSSQERRWYAYR